MQRLTNTLLVGLLLGLSTSLVSLPAQATTATRTSAFEYDPTSGLLVKEIIEPDDPNLCLVTTYAYDAYGNKTGSTTRNCNGSSGEAAAPTGAAVIQSRTSTTSYAATTANPVAGQFPTTSANALGHSETKEYDPRHGKVTKLTGPNGLTTTWEYDGFGRKVKETRADGTWTAWSYEECGAGCPAYGAYAIRSTEYSSTGVSLPPTLVYYDKLNREVRSRGTGFDGRYVNKDTEYNNRGLVYRVSRPYYDNETPQWTISDYDELGRPYQIEDADNSITTYLYQGLTTHATNPKGQVKTETKNSQGQLVSVTDALGFVTTFTYDPFGNLTRTIDPNGNQIVNTYDARGRKVAMDDPDMGHWTYVYNALGELVSQTDAKNQTVSNTYDKLGRLTHRAEPDLITHWYYDQYKNGSACAAGVGKLCEVSSDNAMGQRIYYEGFGGRISVIAHTIDTTYWAYRSYDEFGRASTQSVNAVFATRNVYNANGHLAEVRRDSDNGLLWRADARDAEGRVTQETLGNGVTSTHTYNAQNGRLTSIQANGPNGSVQNQTYTYDSIGNLTARTDAHLASNETFTYDDLNRLTGAGAVTVQYDSLGNITNKSDVGAYTYGRPHGVTQAGGNTYTYDANGNQITGAGRTLGWTSYNLPNLITEAINGTPRTTTFLYDYNHVRAYQANGTKTVVYLNPRIDLGGHYNKETAGGIVTESYYFYAGGEVVGAYVTKTNASPQTNYFHADHLGSISVVTDQSGQVIARYQFDPWGKRTLAAGSNATIHGFTGHEHLDDGLIHMNGRVYDPVLARFLSADPNIQDPTNLQSWNRYSYVLNNPLAFTDPSGYFSLSKFFKNVVKPVVAAWAGYYTFGFVSGIISNVPVALVAGAAAGGAVTSLINTGTLNGWQNNAVSTLLFTAAGTVGTDTSFSRYAAHAAAGCVSASAGGGDCGRGAASAFAGKWATNNTSGDFFATIVAGGTVSVLGGGKFANGATTAAFGYLYNCLESGECQALWEKRYGNQAIEPVCPECWMIPVPRAFKAFGIVDRVFSWFQQPEAPTVVFGTNGESHATRHLIDKGIEVGPVKDAITKDLNVNRAASRPVGEGWSGAVNVDGTRIEYSAYRLPDGRINVGSITPPR